MADDDNLNIFEEFYDSIKPGGTFDQNTLNIAKKATDILTPNQETQAEMDAYEKQRQDALNFLYSASGVDPESFQGQQLEASFRKNKELQQLLGFDSNMLKELKYDFANAGKFLFGDANVGLTTMQQEGTPFKELPFNQKFGIAMLPIDALDIIGIGVLATKGLAPLVKTGIKVYGKKSGKTVQDLLNDEQVLKAIEAEQPGFMEELDTTLGGGIIQKRFMSGKKKRGPTPRERDGDIFNIQQKNIDFGQSQVDEKLQRAALEAEQLKKTTDQLKGFTGEQATDPVKVRVETRGASPSILTSKADEFLLDNPNMSDSKVLEEFLNNPDVYLQGDNVTRSNIKDRRKSLGIKRDRTKFPKLEERKQGMFEDFEKKITGGLDMEDSQAVYDAFFDSYKKAYGETKAVKNLTAENLTNDQLRSARKKLNTLINEYNDLDRGTEIKNQQQINAQRPRTATDEAKQQEDLFNKYLTGTEEYKNILKTLDKGDQKYFRRYIQFVRKSALPKDRFPRFNVESQLVPGAEGNFDNFMKQYKPELDEMLDKNSSFYKDFEEFKRNDLIREEVSELVKPLLNKMFPGGRKSIQIAHRFRGSQIGGTLPEGLAGSGGSPMTYYLDLSVVNYELQDKLEKAAVKAIQNNDRKAMAEISTQAAEIGTEFQISGMTFGKHRDARKQILDLIARAMNEKKFGVTQKELEDAFEAANIMLKDKPRLNKGGLVKDVDDIFEEEQELREVPEQIKKIMPRISVEFGDAARGTVRRFGEEEPEDMLDQPEMKTRAAPAQKTFDVQPTENIFTGEMEQANLKLPLWKLFTKPPVNETAPIPTPKEGLDNPTKKQKESLELEKEKKKDDVFDPTPEDNETVNLVDDVTGMDIAVTPKTNQPITGVFYSDIERALARPDTPAIFPNKKALLDFFRKNRIRDSEFRDYQLESLLRIYDENTPIPKKQIIDHLRQSPIRGMHVHATGQGSEIINPYGEVGTRYEGYAEPGYIQGTQRERVLYIPRDKIAGDSGGYPQGIFGGETVQQHDFGIPQKDDAYIVGWSRLTDRNAILPTKIAATKTQSKIPGLTRERERTQRQLSGLFAEAQNKLNAQAQRRNIPVDEVQAESLEEMLSTYANTLNEISPGLVDQMDELIVKMRDLDGEIAKGSNVDTSGMVRVAFADEIQSDIMQAAAGRKQKLVATLRKILDEGRESTSLPDLSRIGQQALAFFEENKSVFRPLRKSQTEVDIIGDNLAKLDAEVDEIINRYIETRELDPASVKRLQEALTENIDTMINDLITIDSKTYEGLFPDIPFKKREEWADALIKKDLFELAYRKFVLKDPKAPDYYSVTPDQFVIDRYNFKGNSATPMDVRAADKKKQIDYFTARGEFLGSEYKGIGMSEFYGGPNAKTPDGKHYTSVIEKILKTQAKSNNSEFTVLNVQTKSGSNTLYRITDQNGNMVATLTNQTQADRLLATNPNYRVERVSLPTDKNTTPSFAIKITEEMLEPYKTHKAKGGLVQMIDIFEVA